MGLTWKFGFANFIAFESDPRGYYRFVCTFRASIDERNISKRDNHMELLNMCTECSSDFAGTLLNRKLLPDPDLNNNIVGVLLRFGKNAVVLRQNLTDVFQNFSTSQRSR